jgi:hypothetical protein
MKAGGYLVSSPNLGPSQAGIKGIINSTARANGAGFIIPLERFERILNKNDTHGSIGFTLNRSPSTKKKL